MTKKEGEAFPFYSAGLCLSVLTRIISGNFRPFVNSFLVRISNFMGDFSILNECFRGATISHHIYYQVISIFILFFFFFFCHILVMITIFD